MANNNNSNGLSFGGVLCLIFITLKLTGLINWPWLWVLSPLWIGLIVVLLIIIISFIVFVVKEIIERRK